MRLSEAIRLGAMMKPQCYFDFWLGGGSCAMGAALDAVGVTEFDLAAQATELPLIFIGPVTCPACGVVGNIGAMMMHLNDSHRWTRERIADWVESIEHERESAATKPAVVAVAQSVE